MIVTPVEAGMRLANGKLSFIPSPVSETTINRFNDLFLTMLSRAEVWTSLWQFPRRDGEIDSGFIERTEKVNPDDGTVSDPKIFWHGRPELRKQIRERGITLDEIAEEFLSLSEQIYDTYYALHLEVGEGFMPDFEASAAQSGDHCLRMLAYLKLRADGEGFVAQPHLDQSTFTYAGKSWIGEASEGSADDGLCTSGLPHGVYLPMNRPAQHIASFLGAKAQEHFSIPATWHGVRGTHIVPFVTTLNRDGGLPPISIIRVSNVFFGHTHHVLTLKTKRNAYPASSV